MRGPLVSCEPLSLEMAVGVVGCFVVVLQLMSNKMTVATSNKPISLLIQNNFNWGEMYLSVRAR